MLSQRDTSESAKVSLLFAQVLSQRDTSESAKVSLLFAQVSASVGGRFGRDIVGTTLFNAIEPQKSKYVAVPRVNPVRLVLIQYVWFLAAPRCAVAHPIIRQA